MFDMGFTEMMLIGIVALVVIGPERLPGVARTAGKYFSRLRNFMTNVRADVESELKADELREMFEAQQQELQSLKEVVSDAGKDIGLAEIKNELSDVASVIDDTKPIPDPEVKAGKKSTTKAKPVTKAKAKSKSRAKSKVKPKSVVKSKPRTSSKAKPATRAKAKSDSLGKTKAESHWASAIVPPTATPGTNKPKVSKVRSKAVKVDTDKAK